MPDPRDFNRRKGKIRGIRGSTDARVRFAALEGLNFFQRLVWRVVVVVWRGVSPEGGGSLEVGY